MKRILLIILVCLLVFSPGFGESKKRKEYYDLRGKRITADEFYKKGVKKRTGRIIIWNENGQKTVDEFYKNGKRHGKSLFFHEKYQMLSEMEYKEGLAHGRCINWYKNGQKKSEGYYQNDKKHGKWTFWRENGQQKTIEEWKNGKFHGSFIYWYKNGRKKQEEAYIDGKSQRIQRWYSNGQTQSIETYLDGKIQKCVECYNDGQKESECTFDKNGMVHGKWLEWYPTGEKKGEGILNHGTGTFVVFYEKGTKKEHREIKDGKMHGRWIWWDVSGNVVKEEIYKDNKLVKKIQ